MAFRIVACLAVAALVAGCGMFGGKSDGGDTKTVETTSDPYHYEPQNMDPKFRGKTQTDNDQGAYTFMPTLFGAQGAQNNGGAPAVGVNSFLFRAALDTGCFRPPASPDPFGASLRTACLSPPHA